LRRAGHGLLGFAWTVFSWLVIAPSVWRVNLFPFIAAGLVLLATLPGPSALKRADDTA
jgi:hypothetical protein